MQRLKDISICVYRYIIFSLITYIQYTYIKNKWKRTTRVPLDIPQTFQNTNHVINESFVIHTHTCDIIAVSHSHKYNFCTYATTTNHLQKTTRVSIYIYNFINYNLCVLAARRSFDNLVNEAFYMRRRRAPHTSHTTRSHQLNITARTNDHHIDINTEFITTHHKIYWQIGRSFFFHAPAQFPRKHDWTAFNRTRSPLSLFGIIRLHFCYNNNKHTYNDGV